MKANIKKIILTLLLFAGIVVSYTPEGGFRLSAGTEAQARDERDDWCNDNYGYDPSEYWENWDIKDWAEWASWSTGGIESSLSDDSPEDDGYTDDPADPTEDGEESETGTGGDALRIDVEMETQIKTDCAGVPNGYAEINACGVCATVSKTCNDTEPDPIDPNSYGQDDEAVEEDECTDAHKAANKIQAILAQTNAQNINLDIKACMDSLRAYATDSLTGKEYGLAIQYYPASNTYQVSDKGIQEGNSKSIDRAMDSYTFFGVHTHPVYGLSTPSAPDVNTGINLALWKKQLFPAESDSLRLYQGEYIVASDGSEYFVYVEDIDKAANFLSRYCLNDSQQWKKVADSETAQFLIKSALYERYVYAYYYFKNEKYFNQNESGDFAMAYALQESGVALMKKRNGSNNFVLLKTEKITTPSNIELYKAINVNCNE